MQTPKHNLDNEIAILGACLVDKLAIVKSNDVITAEMFYFEKHQIIYNAILDLYNKDIAVDIITISEQLNKIDKLEYVGGTFYIVEINANTPSSANVKHHAFILKEHYLHRQMRDIATEMLQISDNSSDILESFEKIENKITSVNTANTNYQFNIQTLLNENLEIVSAIQNNPQLAGTKTEIRALDSMITGLKKSDLIIIAGRPSMGKTALALNIAKNISEQKSVLFYSLEMSTDAITARLISLEARLNQTDLMNGQIDNQKDYEDALQTLSKHKLLVDATPSMTIAELLSNARRTCIDNHIDLILVDFIQLVKTKGDNRVTEIENVVRVLKQIAREMKTPVVALSQLNRLVEQRTSKRPVLSDLKESGAIEEIADIVILLYRPEYYGFDYYKDHKGIKQSSQNRAELIIAKHRNGKTGSIHLEFDKPTGLFRDIINHGIVDDRF